MNTVRRIAKNMLVLFIAQMISMGLGFFYMMYTARYLGAEGFGLARLGRDVLAGSEEKPEVPKSNYALTGLHIYDSKVFDVIRTLKPSGRGELEITDVNNEYIRRGGYGDRVLDGYWSDAGTFESLFRSFNIFRNTTGNSR